VVLIDPRSVLIWRGVPDNRLRQRLADLVERSNPPIADQQWLDRRYSKAERLFDKGEFARAYTVAHSLFKLTDNSISVNGKAESLSAKCETGGAEKLREAVHLYEDGDLEEAARIVAAIAVRFEDPDKDKDDRNRRRNDEDTDNVKRQAENLIGRWNGDRKMKKIIRDAMDNAEVEVLLDRGADLEEDGYYRLAKATYVKAIEEHEDAEAAEEAKKRVIRIKTDKDIQAKVAEARQRDAAWRLLGIAEHFEGIEKYKEARDYYERVIAEHADSVAAARAKEWMQELPKVSKDDQTAKAKP
jgi:tetratricopeptide (TPR) repeat protein